MCERIAPSEASGAQPRRSCGLTCAAFGLYCAPHRQRRSPMTDEFDIAKTDRRVVARMVRKNEVLERDVEKSLKALPDLADKATVIETVFEENAGDLEPDPR